MSVTTTASRPDAPARAAASAPAVRARRVRRIVRHIDVWTVLKFSLLLYTCLFIISIVAGMLLWMAASGAGVIGNVESFIEDFGFTDFRFLGGQLLRGGVVIGLMLVVLGTGLNVLLAVLYNLISDVVGGIEISVLEEESARRPVV